MKNNLLSGLIFLSFLLFPLTAVSDDFIRDSTEIRVDEFEPSDLKKPNIPAIEAPTPSLTSSEIESSVESKIDNDIQAESTQDKRSEVLITDSANITDKENIADNENSVTFQEDSYLLSDEEVAIANEKFENIILDDNVLDLTESQTITISTIDEPLPIESESLDDLITDTESYTDYESNIVSDSRIDSDSRMNSESKNVSNSNSDSEPANVTNEEEFAGTISTSEPISTPESVTANEETVFVINIDEENNDTQQVSEIENDTNSLEAEPLDTDTSKTEASEAQQIIIYEEDEETQQTCESFFDLAATVMVARQKDVDIQILFDAANVTFINSPQEESDTYIYTATTEMIELAYEFDIVEIDQQQEIAKQFAYDVYAGCMEMADQYSSN